MTAHLWACCVLGVCAGLASCGGRATDSVESDDGVESEASEPGTSERDTSEPDTSEPDERPTRIGPVRETCEDNPLLAGCLSSGRSAGASSAPPRQSDIDPAEELPLSVAAAQNVLLANCGACHGAPLTTEQASDGINYIADWEQLIQVGLIEECSPERSRVVNVMRSGEMPPPESGLDPVPRSDVELVEQAIEFGCD